MIKKVLVKKDSKEEKVLNKILAEAFDISKYPIEYFAYNKNIKRYLFKEDDKNIGVMVVCFTKNIVYPIVFAVNNKIRSKGYGSKILAKLKIMSKDKKIVLAIELINPKSKDYINQERRRKFYLKNGYKFTGVGVVFFGNHKYELLSNESKVYKKDFKEIFKAMGNDGETKTFKLNNNLKIIR